MRIRKQKNMDDAFMHDLALTGSTLSTSWPAFIHRYDTAARKAWWIQNRAEILKTWISEKPGTRPHDWWVHDAPGYRLKLSGAGPDNEHLAEIAGGSDYGIPGHYGDDFEVEQDQPVFESQASFLKKHGIMSLAEKSRLKPYDFDPERLKY